MTHRRRAASAASCGNENRSHAASETLLNVALALAFCRAMLYDVAQEREPSHHYPNPGTMAEQSQNVLISFTQEECRFLRRALECEHQRQLDDAQLFNGTYSGEVSLKAAGMASLLARRILNTQTEVK